MGKDNTSFKNTKCHALKSALIGFAKRLMSQPIMSSRANQRRVTYACTLSKKQIEIAAAGTSIYIFLISVHF